MDRNSSNEQSSSKIGLVVAVVVVALGIGGAVYALNAQQPTNESKTTSTSSSSDNTNTNDSSQGSPNDNPVSNIGSTVITFTDDGFDKSEYKSKAGEAVTVKNDSSNDVQFSSDDHPTHRENPELNLDVLSPGESATFTPPGVGTFKFHDHIDDQYIGTLVVE